MHRTVTYRLNNMVTTQQKPTPEIPALFFSFWVLQAPKSSNRNDQTHLTCTKYIYIHKEKINLVLINTVRTLFQSQCYSFYVKQQNMSQLLIYVVKNGKDFVFLWRSVSVCVCAQHQNLVWLCAMQLEAIIEPITFCLLLSLFSSFLFFCRLLDLSPPSHSLRLSDFNSLGLTLLHC